ncbi:hypothetical protein PoB_007366900 [Plakobranchus ocellatus]|uniref:Uncharacterized protein n=1 Tax=Plakobranchus ocellatus TaxID=259542 RepID=A0AAV4DSL0_9GAST|nr:hypothetical protein PoB_007366900 [Plakobranchus ocellatus]
MPVPPLHRLAMKPAQFGRIFARASQIDSFHLMWMTKQNRHTNAPCFWHICIEELGFLCKANQQTRGSQAFKSLLRPERWDKIRTRDRWVPEGLLHL